MTPAARGASRSGRVAAPSGRRRALCPLPGRRRLGAGRVAARLFRLRSEPLASAPLSTWCLPRRRALLKVNFGVFIYFSVFPFFRFFGSLIGSIIFLRFSFFLITIRFSPFFHSFFIDSSVFNAFFRFLLLFFLFSSLVFVLFVSFLVFIFLCYLLFLVFFSLHFRTCQKHFFVTSDQHFLYTHSTLSQRYFNIFQIFVQHFNSYSTFFQILVQHF